MKCYLEDCNRDSEKVGLCHSHYQRFSRNGKDFDKSPIKEMTILGRFKHKMGIKNQNSCIEYMGEKSSDGYGKFYTSKKIYTMAHRMAYELFIGNIPKGMLVCHKCDNPSCINPEHLWLGTHHDNMQDMADKGRHPNKKGIPLSIDNKGSKHVLAKLNEDSVKNIKIKLANGIKGSVLAREYNVVDQTIYEIKNGRNWKHVTI